MKSKFKLPAFLRSIFAAKPPPSDRSGSPELRAPSDPVIKDTLKRLEEFGISGTRVSGGEIIGYETNPYFYRWSNWALTGNEMMITDPKILGAITLLYNTLLSAEWRVTPASDSAYDRMLADTVAQQLGLNGYSPMLKTSWEQQLAAMLPFAPIGARYLEEMWKIAADGRVWLSHWDDREPTAHARWEFDKEGNFSGVTQYVWNAMEPDASPIPADKLLLLTLNRTAKNLRGVGMLRPAYPWWKLKSFIAEVLGVGAERWAVPTPKVTVDRALGREKGYSDPDIDLLVEAAQRVASEYAAQARSYVQDTPFVTLGVFGEGTTMDFKGPLDVISYCDQAILTALVMQFMEIGFTETGARNVTEIHEGSFRMSAINLLDKIADTIMAEDAPGQGTMHRMLKFNYGAVPASSLPKLTHSGLQTDKLVAALSDLPGLVEAGLVDRTPALKARIAEHLDVPTGTIEQAVVEEVPDADI